MNEIGLKLLVPAKKNDISRAWIIWSIAGLFYLYEMILRVSPSVMTYELMRDFQVSSVTLGVLSSFYYYAYVIFQIPCGLFLDKLGPRKIVTFSALLCVIGALLFARSSCLLSAQIGRFLIGAGSACAFISCLKITAEWFKPTQFALIAGLTNMMGTLGAAFGARPLAILVNLFGWRQTIFLMALAGIPVAFSAWFFIKDHSSMQREINQMHSPKSSIKFGQNLKIIIGNKQIWLAGVIGGFMYLPISAFTELWAIPFLMSSYEINNELASSMSVMLIMGMAIGSPLAAWKAENLRSYKKIIKQSIIISSLLFTAIIFARAYNPIIMFILLFLIGLVIGAQVLCFTCAKLNSDHKINGTTMAFTNALVMMSGVVFQPALGWILDCFWDGNISETGVRIYSHACYQISILALPMCLAFSFFLLNFLNDPYNTPKNELSHY
jgi:MFS family permease